MHTHPATFTQRSTEFIILMAMSWCFITVCIWEMLTKLFTKTSTYTRSGEKESIKLQKIIFTLLSNSSFFTFSFPFLSIYIYIHRHSFCVGIPYNHTCNVFRFFGGLTNFYSQHENCLLFLPFAVCVIAGHFFCLINI